MTSHEPWVPARWRAKMSAGVRSSEGNQVSISLPLVSRTLEGESWVSNHLRPPPARAIWEDNVGVRPPEKRRAMCRPARGRTGVAAAAAGDMPRS